MVMPRLVLLAPWYIGLHSHQHSLVGGFTLEYRMRSGRDTDSTLITSAPSSARRWPAAGPAHHAVRSRMRTPSRGSAGVPATWRGSRSGQWGASSASRAGAREKDTGATPEILNGTPGWTKRPDGDSTNVL